MILGGFLEFIVGNTFPFVLFCGYGEWSNIRPGL
jgi:succinate-acetate transporter protein